MLSVKESSIEIIKKMADDCSLEDIQYELYVKYKIESGLKDIKNNETVSEKEVDNKIDSWLN